MYCCDSWQNKLLLEPDDEPIRCQKHLCKLLAASHSKTTLTKLYRKLTLKSVIVLIIICLIVINFIYQQHKHKNKLYTELMDESEWLQFKELNKNRSINGVPKSYLVFSSSCQIPDYNPFSKQVMKFFVKQNYTECMPNQKPLTRLVRNELNQSVQLVVDSDVKFDLFGSTKIKCCYREITRPSPKLHVDNRFHSSACYFFDHSIQLPSNLEFLTVKCNGEKPKDPTYANVHYMIKKRADIEERMQAMATKHTKKPLSVLLIGIDSISRLNLIRAMPQTKKYLSDNNWFELMGYNKIGDNTFPNFMAILTGYNSSMAYAKCDPGKFRMLDMCPMIWNDFADNGYATAYAEDECNLTTFNYYEHGFYNQPTDYYMRPILMAAERNLPIHKKNGLTYCLGYTNYVNYLFDYAIDFAHTYHNKPYFGLYWVNSFSHENFSDPSSMDEKIRDYLIKFNESGIYNESMVIFFSDHGIRFGPIRQLEIGWLEERLPFIFISLPEWFRMEYPEFAESLYVNQNRLTNPYDIHMTLKHILKLSNPEYAGKNTNYMPDGCENCHSLFYDVPINRSCSDASIESHWCSCIKFEKIDSLSNLIQDGAKYIIDYMNTNLLGNYLAGSSTNTTGRLETGKSCAKLLLKEIKTARKGTLEHLHIIENYLIVYETTPGDAIFETTLGYEKKENKFQITGTISRLNKYVNQSSCVLDINARKYCYCIDDL